MKVKEVIGKLQQLDPELPVIMGWESHYGDEVLSVYLDTEDLYDGKTRHIAVIAEWTEEEA